MRRQYRWQSVWLIYRLQNKFSKRRMAGCFFVTSSSIQGSIHMCVVQEWHFTRRVWNESRRSQTQKTGKLRRVHAVAHMFNGLGEQRSSQKSSPTTTTRWQTFFDRGPRYIRHELILWCDLFKMHRAEEIKGINLFKRSNQRQGHQWIDQKVHQIGHIFLKFAGGASFIRHVPFSLCFYHRNPFKLKLARKRGSRSAATIPSQTIGLQRRWSCSRLQTAVFILFFVLHHHKSVSQSEVY